MTRPVERTYHPKTITPNTVSGVRDDATLQPGVSVNGVPPRLLDTDRRVSVLRVFCAGCSPVAVVYVFTRGGKPLPIVACQVQCVEDWASKPPASSVAMVEVRPGGFIEADCPAHGLVRIPADAVLDRARDVVASWLTSGADLPQHGGVLDVKPEGRRAPIARPDAMTLDEVNRFLGWSRDTR